MIGGGTLSHIRHHPTVEVPEAALTPHMGIKETKDAVGERGEVAESVPATKAFLLLTGATTAVAKAA